MPVRTDQEFERLQALVISQETRIRELEEALSACLVKGIQLRAVLRYHSDAPTVD